MTAEIVTLCTTDEMAQENWLVSWWLVSGDGHGHALPTPRVFHGRREAFDTALQGVGCKLLPHSRERARDWIEGKNIAPQGHIITLEGDKGGYVTLQRVYVPNEAGWAL